MSDADEHVVWSGRYLQAVSQDGWEYVKRTGITGIVVIVAITRNGELVLVEQHRTPVGRNVIELPAGLVGDEPDLADEPMEDAARRELEEETGFRAGRMEKLFTGFTSGGLADEEVTVYLATFLERVSEGGGDANEDITVHIVPIPELRGWLKRKQKRGVAVDVKVHLAVMDIKRPGG